MAKAQRGAKAAPAEKPAVKVVCDNRRARHEYEIIEVFQTGIDLVGTEVKSMRQGKANLQDAFARVEDGQLWLYNCHVSPYDFGNRFNHDPLRRRRLLMHRGEIRKLNSRVKEKGLTLIPLRLYFQRNWVKVDLALARGKHLYDKRETVTKRESKRQLERLLKQAR
jgi:SsrA-binding protein